MTRRDRLAPDGGATEVTPDDLYDRIEAGDPVTILDVRLPQEYDRWHVDGPSVESVNLAPSGVGGELDVRLDDIPEADPLVVVCAKGISSATVAAALRDRGRAAVNLVGGMEGWARVYRRRLIAAYDGPGTLYQYQRPSAGCLAYLLVAGDEAAVVDPLRAFTDRYLADAAAEGATLAYALDTHVHADHFSGVRALAAEGVDGFLPAAAIDRGVTFADEIEAVADGDIVTVGDARVEAIHTPGHTSGMTAFLVADRVLLTGDGLFTESVARPDLERGAEGAGDAARRLYRSLHERVLPLGADVVVAPGHASEAAVPAADGTITARLGDVRARMSILDADEDAFVDRVLADVPPRPANVETIVAANLGQRRVADAEAFQLELGPNNCATSTTALEGER